MKKFDTILLMLALLWSASSRLSAQSDLGALTTVSQIRNLSAVEAAKHYPVKLRGVVTFYDDGLFLRFMQDDTGGIYLQVTNTLALKAGQLIELEGATGPGEFAPVVLPTSVKLIGDGKMPVARPATVRQLLSGTLDSQMVEISGVVRSARFEKSTGNCFVEVVADGERFTVIAKEVSADRISNLWGATVQVRGVCSTLFNRQRQLFGFQLLVPNAEGLVVETPAAMDPFNLSAQSMDSLLQFTPESVPAQHVKVAGTVTYFEPGNAVFIQNGKNGLRCQTIQREPALKPGDQVEVVGSPAKGEYAPILEDAIFRKTGTGAEPQPDAVDLNQILTGDHDCRLVQISAKVLERVDRGVNQFLLLSVDDFVFQAYLTPDMRGDRLANLVNGSEVRGSGICLIERGNHWQAGEAWRAKSFRLILRSPGDIEVMRATRQNPPETWLLIVGAMEVVALGVLIRLAYYVKRKSRTAN